MKAKTKRPTKYLRQTTTGHIYHWTPQLSERQDMEPYVDQRAVIRLTEFAKGLFEKAMPSSHRPDPESKKGQEFSEHPSRDEAAINGSEEIESAPKKETNRSHPHRKAQTTEPTFSPSRLQKISDGARKIGGITLQDLMCILAEDEGMAEALFSLWTALGLDSGENHLIPPRSFPDGEGAVDEEGSLVKATDRAGAWFYVLMCMARTSEADFYFPKEKFKYMPDPLCLYSRGPDGFEPLDPREERGLKHYVKLDELAEYLENRLHKMEVKADLPKRLFPDGWRKEEADQDLKEEQKVFSIDTDRNISISEKNDKDQYYFKRMGEYWEIGYNGIKSTIINLSGVHYVAFLLNNPNESFSCLELHNTYNPPETKALEETQALEEGLISSSKEYNKIYDSRAINDFRKRIKELETSQERESDPLIQKENEEELVWLKNEIIKNKGFIDLQKKNAQSAIKKALDIFYKHLDKTDLEKLATHFRTHITPDGGYGYKYTGSLSWKIFS